MRRMTAAVAATLVIGIAPGTAWAQTDFYNLDKDRPLRVEDAYATKRYAFELQVSPLTLAQTRDGTIQYRPSIELKHGLLPGLDLAAGFHLAADRPLPGEPRQAYTQLELTSLLNLTTETRWLPALGVRVTGHIPVEGESASTVEVRGLATRGLFGPLRAHVNGGWSFGDDAHERWWGGVALDYVLPFRHLLLLVETWVAEPAEAETTTPQPPPGTPGVQDDASRRVHSTAGLRYQLSPTLAMDAGIGRTLSGAPRQDWLLTFGLTYEFAVRALMPVSRRPARATAQVERVYHPMYLPAQHNWQFRAQYPAMDRLFAAFDYGHGILYETLYTRPDAPVELLEEEVYRHLVHDVLRNPPRMHMPERAFMPRYARLVPLAKEMFEWAHILHRQTYDILADDRIVDKDAAMEELLEYYLSSPLAFTDVPKGMAIMDEQYFSQEFRQQYPKFNGLIWAYHWLQVAVHEPFLLYDTAEERQTATKALLARFWQMLEDPPAALPSEMPMTAAIAPQFTERFPRFAAIFDNLHMMHDVISDILVSDQVTDKRAEIYRQADLFRDPEAMAVSREEWIAMALAHGLDAQGGPAVEILPPAPTLDAMPHHPEHHHPGHQHPEPEQPHEHPAADTVPAHHRAMALILDLLEDEHVQHRIHADPELHAAWAADGVQEHLAMMRRMHETGVERPEPPHDDPAMHRAMTFIVRLLEDAHVQHRIHAVPEHHAAWEDPAVQAHIQRMRQMHGGAHDH